MKALPDTQYRRVSVLAGGILGAGWGVFTYTQVFQSFWYAAVVGCVFAGIFAAAATLTGSPGEEVTGP